MKFIGWLNNSGLNPVLVEACGKLYASCFEGLTEKDVELGKYLNGLQNGKELPPQPDDVAGSAQHYYYMFGNQPEFTANLLMAGSQVHDPVTDEDLVSLKNVLGEGDPTKLKECATVFTYCDTSREDMVKAAELFRSGNVAEGFNVANDCLTRLGYNVKRYQNGKYTDKTNLSTDNRIGKRVIRNQWLVHGTTPASAIKIAKYGFDRGNKIGMLAYNKSEKANGQKHDYTGDYMFAFDASDDMSGYDLTHYVDINRYGDALVVFKGSGYKVFHEGDDEYQVIFDYHEPTGCFLVLSTQQAKASGFPVRKPADNVVKIYNVQVYGQKDGSFVPLYAACEERECVQWIVDNGDQYGRYMFKWNKPVTESVLSLYEASHTAPKYLFHRSNPAFRDKIKKEGLIPQVGDSYQLWWEDHHKGKTPHPVVFLFTDDALYDTTYDDDVVRVDVDKLDKTHFRIDPSLPTRSYMYDLPIPPDAIEFVYEGSGSDGDLADAEVLGHVKTVDNSKALFKTLEALREELDRRAYAIFDTAQFDEFEQEQFGSLEDVQKVPMDDFVLAMRNYGSDVNEFVNKPVTADQVSDLAHSWFDYLTDNDVLGWQYNWN